MFDATKSRFEKMADDAILPTRAHAMDAGVDLYSYEDAVLPGMMAICTAYHRLIHNLINDRTINRFQLASIPSIEGCSRLFRTGIRVTVPEGHVGLLWDKSGIGNKCIKVAGGVIDEGYTGEVLVRMINLGLEEWVVKKGQKIVQMIIQPIFRDDEDHGERLRGAAGFGSTGF